jgi:hypothetical protein
VPPRLTAALPWALTLAIVGFLVATTDLGAVADALARADWVRLVTCMGLVTGLAWLGDAVTLWPVGRRFVGPVTLAEALRVKALSYFLNVFNYSLAVAGMAWFLARRHSVPFSHALSAMAWTFFLDIAALTALLTAGWLLLPALPAGAEPLVARIPWVVAGSWAVVAGSLLYWLGRLDFLFFGFFRRLPVFHVFTQVTARDVWALVPARAAFICVYIVMHALLLPAFGVSIPLGALLAYAPILAFVQVIPATVSGLGAVQPVMVLLFSPHVPAEVGDPQAVIVAYSTVTGPLMAGLRLLIAWPYVRGASRELVPPPEVRAT